MATTLHRFAYGASKHHAMQFAMAMLLLDWDVPYFGEISKEPLPPTDEPLGDVSVRGNIEAVEGLLANTDPAPPEGSRRSDQYARWHASRIEYLSMACGAMAVLRERFGNAEGWPDLSPIIGPAAIADPDPTPVVEPAPGPAPVVEPAPAPVVEPAPEPAPVVEPAPAPAPVVEPPAPAADA